MRPATTPRLCVTRIIDIWRSIWMQLQQVEDVLLNGHVERRRRLVGDQKIRLAGKRRGDHDALLHSAGELMRIMPVAFGRIGDADAGQ